MPGILQQCFGPIHRLISKRCSEIGFLGHSSNHVSQNQLFQTCWNYEGYLFSKSSKFYVDFENASKLRENLQGFKDNCLWTCCRSFSRLWQEYIWPAVNVLKKCPMISDQAKRHDTQLNFSDINGILAQKSCRADFTSVLDPLKGWYPKNVLKH